MSQSPERADNTQALPCAPWCTESAAGIECEHGGHCSAELEALVATVGYPCANRRGVEAMQYIATGVNREAGAYRPRALPHTALHTIVIGIGLEGEDAEPFVYLTPDQARTLRNRLDDLIQRADEDAEVIQARTA